MCPSQYDDLDPQIRQMVERYERKKQKEFHEKVWTPPGYEEAEYLKEEHERLKRDMLDQYRRQKEEMAKRDPVEDLRREMRKEFDDIKKAIHKIGILLDSDAPTEEQLRRHKALREAYQKYKMVEELTLGKGSDE